MNFGVKIVAVIVLSLYGAKIEGESIEVKNMTNKPVFIAPYSKYYSSDIGNRQKMPVEILAGESKSVNWDWVNAHRSIYVFVARTSQELAEKVQINTLPQILILRASNTNRLLCQGPVSIKEDEIGMLKIICG